MGQLWFQKKGSDAARGLNEGLRDDTMRIFHTREYGGYQKAVSFEKTQEKRMH